MRKIWVYAIISIVFVSVTLPIFTKSQLPESSTNRGDIDHIEPVWWDTYGGYYDDHCFEIKPTSDSGYIVTGKIDNILKYKEGIIEQNKEEILLFKINNEGEKVWQKVFDGGEYTYGNSVLQADDGGFVISGGSRMVDAKYYEAWIIKTDGSGNLLWNKSYGGNGNFRSDSICKSNDGGFYILGERDLYKDDSDIWLLNTDESGNELWNKTFGGEGEDYGDIIKPTSDGGFIILGKKDSQHLASIWLIKLNATGSEEWNAVYDNYNYEHGWYVEETSGNGFIIVGYAYQSEQTDDDVLLIKTDKNGNNEWIKTYGGSDDDYGYCVKQTNDNGYIITGYTESYGSGYRDIWLYKINETGILEWDRVFGNNYGDEGKSLIIKDDGGIIVAGETNCYGEGRTDIIILETDSKGAGGIWSESPECTIKTPNDLETVSGLVELSGTASDKDGEISKVEIRIGETSWNTAKGSESWQYTWDSSSAEDGEYRVYVRVFDNDQYSNCAMTRIVLDNAQKELGKNLTDVVWWTTFGGPGSEMGYTVQETSDGGLIIGAETSSSGNGGYDIWLIKTNSMGEMFWSKTFGEKHNDRCKDVEQTKDGGYIIVGQLERGIPVEGRGFYIYGNLWLIKTNDKGEEQWNRTFGGNEAHIYDEGISVTQASDGGYLIVGNTQTYSDDFRDMWVIKTDSYGNELWNNTFEGSAGYRGNKIIGLPDSGYVLLGTEKQDNYNENTILMKIDNNGNEEWSSIIDEYIGDAEFLTLKQTHDNGFIVVGIQDIGFNENDVILVKTDFEGKVQWTKNYGGNGYEVGHSVQQTFDGGYIIVGGSNENDDIRDIYIIKTTSSGEEEWDRIIGWSDFDDAYSVIQTADSGYVIVGQTSSYYTGDSDVILIKLGNEGGEEIIEKPPDCLISNPVNLSDVFGKITISGEASSPNRIIEKVEIRIDDEDWLLVNGTNFWSYKWESNYVDDGEHVIYARSFDGETYSNTSIVKINVDNVKVDTKNDDNGIDDDTSIDENIDKKPKSESIVPYILAIISAIIVIVIIFIILIQVRKKETPFKSSEFDPRKPPPK